MRVDFGECLQLIWINSNCETENRHYPLEVALPRGGERVTKRIEGFGEERLPLLWRSSLRVLGQGSALSSDATYTPSLRIDRRGSDSKELRL